MKENRRGLVCLVWSECISASFYHSHKLKEVSKAAILPLTVLMHYDDTPTTDRRPSKNPFMPHFGGWMERNQNFFQNCDYHVLAQ